MYEIINPQNSGRVVALWSPVNRQGAVSTTAAVLASYMGKAVDDGKVLVLSTDASNGPNAYYYMTTEKMTNGLAEVIELSISDNLSSVEDIRNNTFSLNDNIDILACSKIGSNVTDFLSREIVNILNMARRGYKYIVVDCINGRYDMATKEVLEAADIIIVCMPQDKYIFESWIRKMENIYLPLVEKKPTIIVSAMHYEYEDMTYSDMNKELKDTELYYISLNDLVHKANSERDIPDMVSSHFTGKRRDDIIEEIESIYEKIEEYIENIIDNEIDGEQEIAAAAKKETQKYLVINNSDLFSDMGYEDDDNSGSSDTSGYDYDSYNNQNQGYGDAGGYEPDGYNGQDGYEPDGYSEGIGHETDSYNDGNGYEPENFEASSESIGSIDLTKTPEYDAFADFETPAIGENEGSTSTEDTLDKTDDFVDNTYNSDSLYGAGDMDDLYGSDSES